MANVRRYTDEERLHIFNKVNEAKSKDLDIGAVYKALADKFGVPDHSIKNQYSVQYKRENKPETITVSTGLIPKIRQLIKERDNYKESSQLYKEQRDDVQKKYNALKNDHDKLLRELQSLEELMNS